MKYCVIGAGGTGGCIGAYLAAAGKDVTLIARGAHLAAIKRDGLRIFTSGSEIPQTIPVNAANMEQYNENPDVIFVCVKGYSLSDTLPFIHRIARKGSVIIPILNIYGTGGKLQQEFPELLVTDGCIYIASEIKEPGALLKKGDIFRIVFGVRNAADFQPILTDIQCDLTESGITAVLSDNIQRDALQKYAYISPAATCGVYYNVSAGEMQKKGEIRDCFALLIHEIDLLAYAMGIRFQTDLVQSNLEILDALAPEASTSMQRDLWNGKNSEIDGLIYEVLRMGDRYGQSLPTYRKIAEELRLRGL